MFGTPMAPRKTPEPPPLEDRKLTPQEIDVGIAKLRRRIDEIEKLRSDGAHHDDGRKETAESNVRNTIREIFGERSPQFRENEHFEIHKGIPVAGANFVQHQSWFLNGIPPAITFLQGLISHLEEQKEFATVATSAPSVSKVSQPSRRIFIVHGHDGEAKEATARFLTNLDFEPIILHEQVNGGRALIEKFEKYSDVAFAVVLLTPDDVGAKKDQPGATRPRPRQNVVLELGFFLGQLGRGKVCPLVKGDIELPSDYDGVAYVQMDAGNGWKLTLAREIKAAGLAVDGSKLMMA
jgi:predicted nucleotide-binding protein